MVRRALHALPLLTVLILLAVALPEPTGQAPGPEPAPAAEPAGDLHAPDEGSLGDPTPHGVPREHLAAGRAHAKKAAAALPDTPRPVGGAQTLECRRDLTQPSSSRRGLKPMSGKLHYTVSANRPGWDDVYAIHNYFKRTGAASATFIIDFEGHCLQGVPLDRSPWTQLAFNPTSWSVEIIATGRETRAEWLRAPIFQRGLLAELIRDTNRRLGLPLRWVDPEGCRDELGYTDHDALECGNDHTDVRPAFPYDVLARQLAAVDDQARKVRKWRRSHRIAHRKLRECGARRARDGGSFYCRRYRARNRRLHALIARDAGG